MECLGEVWLSSNEPRYNCQEVLEQEIGLFIIYSFLLGLFILMGIIGV